MNESIRVHEATSCLLCSREGILLYQGLRDRFYGAPGTWSLLRCSDCGLVWLHPRPVPADIGKLYEQYFTHDTTNGMSDPVLPTAFWNAVLAARFGYKDLSRSPLQTGLGNILSWIGPIRDMAELRVMTLGGPPKGTLLDVGCGAGQFLAEMRQLGWEVMGVEPDSQAVKVARGHFGLSVHEGTLEEAGFAEATFDAIAMHHVIEHVSNPIGTLKECHRVLKPGGRLIVVTPNIESLMHRVFREACSLLDPPRHLYLFSSHTLRTCAERAGLRLVTLRTTARAARGLWKVSYLIYQNRSLLGRSPVKNGLWLRLGGLAFQALEHGLSRVTDAAGELVLVATRVNA